MKNLDQEMFDRGKGTELAAEILPLGWTVRIEIEKDGGSVELIGPDGDTHDYPSNHEWMSEEIHDAVDYAIEKERQ